MEYGYDKGALTIRLIRQIDSSNAADVEKELFGLIEEKKADSVVLDAADTQYISSAGLRVVLKLKKTVPDSKVVNASSEVYEIFNITGFSSIIDVKKALREISVEGCEIIGKGGHGTVYRLNGDTILKLYSDKEPLDEIEREIDFARNAFVSGIPTAIPFDVVKCGECYGSVFELINADTFGNVLSANPGRIDEFSRKYTELIDTLHSTKADTSRLTDIKELYNKWTDDLADKLTADEISVLHDIINSVPDRDTFIHGDIHPQNVLVQNDELILIDMANISYGHPIFDFAGMVLTHVIAKPKDGEKSWITGLDYEVGLRLWNDLIKSRFGALGENAVQQINQLSMAFGMMKYTLASAVNKTHSPDLDKALLKTSRERFFPTAKNLIGAVKF